MASTIPPPNRVKLLYNRQQILNIIFGILIGLIAVLRWYTGRDEFDRIAFLISLADSSMLTLVCILPQYMITIYCYFRKESCVGLEAYISTGAMVLNDYVALLMINTGYFRILLFPAMILFFIITIGWKLRKGETVEVIGNQQKTNEETPSVTRTNSSDKLELFGFVSYLLLLSLVTWTRYKRQQGCTPVLSDFLLFLGSAVGALGTMLASPLAGVNSRAVSAEVLPVLHKTCAVLLFIAVHTLAAEWLGEDMIYVCLPELITVLVWFTVCFGESTSVSSLTSYISQATIVGLVVAVLACLIPNIPVSWIMWLFWISISSAAFSQFHVWLLQGWPESSSEPNKLICLLNVATTVCSATAAILSLCAYMMITETMILYEAIYSFQHKAMAAVAAIIFLLAFLVWSACYFLGYLETRLQIPQAPILDKLLKVQQDTLPSTDVTFLQSKQKDMHSVITKSTVPEKVGTPVVSKYEIDPINKESYEILEENKSHRNLEHESQEILEEQKPNEYDERSEGRTPDKRMTSTKHVDVYVDFNCSIGDYAAFMDDLCEKLVDHPDKAVIHGLHVLAKQQHPKPPKRWMHIKLVGNNDETTTLAVRDDNVQIIGFQAKNGMWYEFGSEGRSSVHMLRDKESTFLGCNLTYRRLLDFPEKDGESRDGVAMILQHQLKLGKKSALDAIRRLSAYQQPKGQSVDKGTKKALASLIVMICESARLAPIYNTVKNGWNDGSVITEQQVHYIYNWGKMSGFLMGKLEPSLLRNIGIVEEKDAAVVVNMLLNFRGGVPLVHVPAVVSGRFMVEMLSMKANYLVVGTIRVVDGKGGRIITFNYPVKGAIRNSQSQGNDPVSVYTTPMAPSGDVSTNKSFSVNVNVNPDGGYDEYGSDSDDNFTDESKSVSSTILTIDSTDNETDLEFDGSTVIQVPYGQGEPDSIINSTHNTKDGTIEMAYAELSNAVEATVQVKLKPRGVMLTPDATVRVYGEIVAECNGSNIILLVKREEEDVRVDVLHTSDGVINIPIPLARSVFAVTVDSPIILKFRLHAKCSSYDSTISFQDVLRFPTFSQRPKHTKKINGPGMVAQVVITTS